MKGLDTALSKASRPGQSKISSTLGMTKKVANMANLGKIFLVKFMFSEKATKFEKIFHLKFEATQ